jgi:hypothetical protein
MKKATLFFLFISLPFFVTVRADDSLSKDSDWRFAAGVTLYSNNDYTGYLDLSHRPLEVNFRIKMNRHTLRMGIPVAIKMDMGAINYPGNYNRQTTLEEYYNFMLTSKFIPSYYQTMENKYSLYGVSLGYDFTFSITPAFSAFAGFDLAHYNSLHQSRYFAIGYTFAEDKSADIFLMSYNEIDTKWSVNAVKPLLGLRYQFQKLIFEAYMNYSIYSNSYTAIKYVDSYYPGFTSAKEENDVFISPADLYQKFEYQLSVVYAF